MLNILRRVLKKNKETYLITSIKDLSHVKDCLKSENIFCIDTEFDWRTTYFPKLSTLQLGFSKKTDNLPPQSNEIINFIYKNFKQGSTFVHFNGSYHSNNFESIYWYLKKLDPNLKISTINAVEQSDISSLDSTNRGTANFIIAIPDDMTKTY